MRAILHPRATDNTREPGKSSAHDCKYFSLSSSPSSSFSPPRLIPPEIDCQRLISGGNRAEKTQSAVSPGSGRSVYRSVGGSFNGFLNTIFLSPPTVGLIVSIFLDNTLEVEKSKKDRGMPWWVKFRTFRGDNRNEEFYTLPFNLNRFFPPT
ncbi:hypothetical protein BHM03_00001103 [Ensete ventricosum]|uniref:Uncharacterized protein n=1 Tax=Ensete ventricosum TaxID=4639 RepID=A0A445M8Y0_ENSVE|nr:hypothetical protein BHM03_00001103 [Ensete ventricosum]